MQIEIDNSGRVKRDGEPVGRFRDLARSMAVEETTTDPDTGEEVPAGTGRILPDDHRNTPYFAALALEQLAGQQAEEITTQTKRAEKAEALAEQRGATILDAKARLEAAAGTIGDLQAEVQRLKAQCLARDRVIDEQKGQLHAAATSGRGVRVEAGDEEG